MPVLVVGATGSIGSRVAQDLLARKASVRAVVRSGSRASAVPEGVEAVVADLNEPTAVQAAMTGIDRVVLIAANSPAQADQERTVVEAARRAGVQHLVKLSVGGAAPDAGLALARAHWEAEIALQESDVPFSIVRPGFFMQNLLQYADWIDADGSWRLPMGSAPIAMVHATDVAQVIATVVLSEPLAADAVVTGGAALTMEEATSTISRASGRLITYVDGDPAEYAARMVAAGNDEEYARDMTVLYDQIIRAGYAGAVSDDVHRILHRPPLTFAAFAQEHADAFREPRRR
jgi:uncharacterized protein YbjT (DUF2867 family)